MFYLLSKTYWYRILFFKISLYIQDVIKFILLKPRYKYATLLIQTECKRYLGYSKSTVSILFIKSIVLL